jgi:hypothetical protein
MVDPPCEIVLLVDRLAGSDSRQHAAQLVFPKDLPLWPDDGVIAPFDQPYLIVCDLDGCQAIGVQAAAAVEVTGERIGAAVDVFDDAPFLPFIVQLLL